MLTRLLLFLSLSLTLSSCLDLLPGSGGGGSTDDGRGGQGTYGRGDDTYGQSAPMGAPRPAEPNVHVDNIRLTGNYTILYLTYTERGERKVDNTGRVMRNAFIAFDSRAQLVAANGARVFRFIKADNIPIQPKQLNTYSGQQYSFAVDFEPLDRGIENFDLFECNDYDYIKCWNIYNLYVRNPADQILTTPPVQTQTQTPYPDREQPARAKRERPYRQRQSRSSHPLLRPFSFRVLSATQ